MTHAASSPELKKSGRLVRIEPVTRIEGHAKITIHLDEAGEVVDARVHLLSMRGFEKFIEGKPAEEVPQIVSRICGICPWQHQIASVQAVDGCFGVEPPPAARQLRELIQMLAHVADHMFHFFFLAAPDFLDAPRAGATSPSISELARRHPDLASRVFAARGRAMGMIERFAGRAMHAAVLVPGGVSRPMPESERAELAAGAAEILEFARFALEYGKKALLAFLDADLRRLGEISTGFLGMVHPVDGALELHHGVLRLMRPDGSSLDFEPGQYTRYIGEHVEPWSHGKFPYARGWGEDFSMDPAHPRGIYRTNGLARLNVAEFIRTPLAQEELEEFRARFGHPVQSVMLNHWARLIGLLHASERAVELLNDPEIADPLVRAPVSARAGRAVGCIEAPRGTLIHDYTTDTNGFIVRANLIVGTTHNLAPINMSVRKAACGLVSKGVVDEALLNRVEMVVRAYDPCFSCATHRLDGGRDIEVVVVDKNGRTLAVGGA